MCRGPDALSIGTYVNQLMKSSREGPIMDASVNGGGGTRMAGTATLPVAWGRRPSARNRRMPSRYTHLYRGV